MSSPTFPPHESPERVAVGSAWTGALPPGAGLPASPTARRLGVALLALAILAYWLGATYGITAPFYYGHYGYHGGSYATWARGTLRFHTIYPVNEPGFGPPDPATYYIHHPVFTHQLVTLTFLIFGQHEWSVRLAATLPSFASLLLVAALGWRYLGPIAGGAAALIFAIVPVNIWYEAHIDQGFPSIAFLLAFFFFYLRWLGSGRWKHGIAALVCEAMAGNFEWSPYFAFVAIFAHVAWTARRRRGRFLTFAFLHPLTVIAPLGFHAFLVLRAHLFENLMAAYRNRTSAITYGSFAARMVEYAHILFGSPLLCAMLLWLTLVLVRVVKGRARAIDLVGCVFAFTVIVYMHVFKTAVVTHAYRQLYGNVWAAMAVAGLAADAGSLAVRLRGLRRASSLIGRARTKIAAAVVVTVAFAASTIPRSWTGLIESRLHGGVPGWTVFDPDLRQTAFAARVEQTTAPHDVLYFHPSLSPWPPPQRMDWAFYYDRDLRRWVSLRSLLSLSPVDQKHAVAIVLPSRLQGDELRVFGQLGLHHKIWQVQDMAAIDLRSSEPSVEAFRLADPARASATGDRPVPVPWHLGAWMTGPYPFPKLVADPVATAKLASLIHQAGAPPPPPAPQPMAVAAQPALRAVSVAHAPAAPEKGSASHKRHKKVAHKAKRGSGGSRHRR